MTRADHRLAGLTLGFFAGYLLWAWITRHHIPM